MQTAEVLVHELGIPYAVTDALREYDCGVMEERSDEIAWKTYEEVLRDWVDGQLERYELLAREESEIEGHRASGR